MNRDPILQGFKGGKKIPSESKGICRIRCTDGILPKHRQVPQCRSEQLIRSHPADQFLECLFADLAWDGVADLFKAGEVPQVGELAALEGLDWLYSAIVSVEENAFPIRLIFQGEAAAIAGEPGEALNELMLRKSFELRNARDFRIREAHLPGPPAAGGAALAFVENRHGGEYFIAFRRASGCSLPRWRAVCYFPARRHEKEHPFFPRDGDAGRYGEWRGSCVPEQQR